jgi:hypothetical protein
VSARQLSRIYKQKIKQRFAAMDDVFGVSADELFAGSEDIPNPLFLGNEFDVVEAWWLAELCRLSYTPDSKEFSRVWNASKPDRMDVLGHRTPFRELLDVHKTGNSAAIYEIGSEGTVLCFRGTAKAGQWISNMVFRPHEWARFKEDENLTGAFVHSGFYLMFKRIWPLLWPTLRLAPRPWIFTGHSLGGALAMFANAVAGADKVYTFGAPRIGNSIFATTYLNDIIRVVNDRDIVPLLPARDKSKAEKEFDHGGQLIFISDEGELIEDPMHHNQTQPWHLLEDWTKQPDDLFRKTPPWIRDHLMGQYCRKIATNL